MLEGGISGLSVGYCQKPSVEWRGISGISPVTGSNYQFIITLSVGLEVEDDLTLTQTRGVV